MKERILESKVNRAYKTFIQRPTTTQRRELNLIAEGSSKLPVAEQITNFCKKHLLMGKENFVAKKILKSRTDILKPEVYSALIMIVKGVETTSQSEMSSDEKGKLINQKKTETGKIQTLEKPQTAPETKKKSINDKKPSVPRARVVQAPAIQTEEKVIAKITSTSVKRHILPEKTAVSLKSKANLKEEVLPEKSVEMDSAPDVKKSSNIQKEIAIDYDHVVNMFSSDDDDLKEKKSQVDVTSKNVEHILVVPDVKEEQLINVPEIKDVRKIRTRSVSKSCSETSDTCSVKAKKVVKTKSLTETTPISPDVKSLPRSMKKLKEKRRRSSDVFFSLNQEPKPKLMKQNFVKETVPETEKVSDLFKITNDKIKSKEKKEKNKLKKSFPRVHPALISRESLPFTVGSNSPLPHIPPTPASPDFSFAPFVPDVEDVMEEGLDQEEVFPSDMSEDAKLQIILKEMEFPLPVQLSPLSLNKRMSMEKDEFDFPALLDDVEMTKDEDLDVEEESRISISPSADLCTALNFGSQSTQKASKQKKASKKSKIKQETKVTGTVNMNPVVSLQRVDLRDTPRRFSCEAPVRARAVPTIKPVVKNPPSDPSIISNQPAVGAQTVSWRPDSSFKAFNPKDTTSLVSKEKTTSSESDKKTSFNSPQNLSKGQAISKVKENPHSSGNLPKTPSVEEKDDHFAPDVSMSSENFKDDNESETPLTLLDKLQASSSSKDPTLKTTPLKAVRESSQEMDGIFKQLQCYATNSSKNSNNLPCSTVVSWVAAVAMHTFSFDVNKALEAKADTKDPTCYMHPVEAEFVQRVLVMERVRTKTRKGLIKSTVLPVLMRIICRYGQSLYSVKTLFSKTPVFDILSPILINSELPMPYLQSVIRIFCSMSRGLGCGRYVMEICRYGIISRSSNDVSTIIATAIICWPSLFTQHYPLSGKIVVSSLLHRILSTQLNTTKKENQLKLFTSLLNLLGWPNTQDVKTLEKNCIECLNACFDRIKAAKLVKSGSFSKLEVENIDDVYIALQILVAMKGIDFLEKNIIMEVFWPLLSPMESSLGDEFE
nr:uncharacterized protein LOC100179393 [Ciona intestinalis]|eukprot:XP_026691151.1 uncharacterized protein LOC100179393 [Ciona intestinalis]